MPRRQDSPPTPPPARGNTLAGVSAEELLGDEGRALLQQMRLREEQAQRSPTFDQPHKPGTPLGPRMHDSSLVAFQSAEYAAGQEVENEEGDDELEPQGNFLSGPTRQFKREVVQTPMPAGEQDYEQPYSEAPSDDLGYERPVDYGQDSEEDPQAHDSAAHEEMEQNAGQLLWLQGVITRQEVEDALASQDDVSEGARQLLEECPFTDQLTLYRFLSRHETLSPVDLETVKPSERALAALRPAIARSYRVVPLERIGELLLVAAAWPFDPRRLLELRRLTSSKVKLFIVTEPEIDAALAQYYPTSSATLRSPPVSASERTDAGDIAMEEITGQGEALERRYDPTLRGEESGLYPPISENTYYPSAGSGQHPREESGTEFDSQAVTGEFAAPDWAPDSAPEEKKLKLDASDELDLNPGAKRETRPEDLDPFGE
jgi:hypothetical protein